MDAKRVVHKVNVCGAPFEFVEPTTLDEAMKLADNIKTAAFRTTMSFSVPKATVESQEARIEALTARVEALERKDRAGDIVFGVERPVYSTTGPRWVAPSSGAHVLFGATAHYPPSSFE